MDTTEVKRIEDMEGTEIINDNDMIIVQFDNGGTKKMLYKDLVKEVKKSLGIEKIRSGMGLYDSANDAVGISRSDGNLNMQIATVSPYNSLRVGGKSRLLTAEIGLPFSFGIDEQGNYGYYKVGADTVTPFKSSVILNPALEPLSLGLINPPTANIDGSIAYVLSPLYDVEQLEFEFYLTSSGIQGYPRSLAIIGNNGDITFSTAEYSDFQKLDDSTGVKLYTDDTVHIPSSVNNGNSNMMLLCALDSSKGKYRILHGLVHITDGSDTIAWWIM